MSKESINRKDVIQQDVRDTADNTESGLDEAGDGIKAGAKSMANKVKDPDKDIDAEFDNEKFKEESNGHCLDLTFSFYIKHKLLQKELKLLQNLWDP
jgi:hypothetical protein